MTNNEQEDDGKCWMSMNNEPYSVRVFVSTKNFSIIVPSSSVSNDNDNDNDIPENKDMATRERKKEKESRTMVDIQY